MFRRILINWFCRPVVVLNGKNNINTANGKKAAEICEFLNSGIFLTAKNHSSDLVVVRKIGTPVEKFWKVYHDLNT